MASDGKWYPPQPPVNEYQNSSQTVSFGSASPPDRDIRIIAIWCVLVVLIGVAVALPLIGATKASTPSDAVIARAVLLTKGDVPTTWQSNHEGGKCIANGPGSKPRAPYCGNAPLPGTNQQASDNTYAQCLGLPVSQISMLTGNDEPGEPPTYSSATFAPKEASSSIKSDEDPTALMWLTVQPSVTAQQKGLAAINSPRLFGCTQSWLKSSPFNSLADAIGSAVTNQSFLPSITFKRVSVPNLVGVQTGAYQMNIKMEIGTHALTTEGQFVVLGAGRLEAYLSLSNPSAYPPGARQAMLASISQRLAAQATRLPANSTARQLTSPPTTAHTANSPVGSTPVTSAALAPATGAQLAALTSAIAKTAATSGYNANIEVKLQIGGATLDTLNEGVTYQAPNRTYVTSTEMGRTLTATVIGNDCWITGGSLGADACDSVGQFSGTGPITALSALGTPSYGGDTYSFTPPDTSATLNTMGISFTPLGGSSVGTTTSTIEVTVAGGFIQTETVSVTQRAANGGELSNGQFKFTFSNVGSAPPVIQPAGPPTGTTP
jgi:hypothetical protein